MRAAGFANHGQGEEIIHERSNESECVARVAGLFMVDLSPV